MASGGGGGGGGGRRGGGGWHGREEEVLPVGADTWWEQSGTGERDLSVRLDGRYGGGSVG